MNSKTDSQLTTQIKKWATELGFQQVGIATIDLSDYQSHFENWLDKNHQADMEYMSKHKEKRLHPEQLFPGTRSIICVAMNYFSIRPLFEEKINYASIARYARGHDYHKLIRRKLKQLAQKIMTRTGPFSYRPFCDSAPILEKALGEQANLGWIGKNTLLINQNMGSWFFTGELFTDLELPIDRPAQKRCGTCTACLDQCPTKALIHPYQLDANRCIAYLTIEHPGRIPMEIRPLMKNHIFGCDLCQQVCPWNRFAFQTNENRFVQSLLETNDLITLFNWNEKTFLKNTEGSPIRRISFEKWQRNIAVALGNSPPSDQTFLVLKNKLHHVSALVREHIVWAMQQLKNTIA